MVKKSKGIILFALTVILLVVVSGRASPAFLPPDRGTQEEDNPGGPDEPPPSLGPAETPEDTPKPTANIREILPGVSRGDWELKLVNQAVVLPESFAPEVSATRNGHYFDTRAVDALETMLSAAEEAGHTVCIRAAYRPYRTQANLFFGRATIISESQGIPYGLEVEEMAKEFVAYPGTSEHQTGLCADIMPDAATEMDPEDCENLPLLLWLREHCDEYGFIARYPKEKKEKTGWYEPWHFRYVGEASAEYIMENDLCLEEFLALF